jgi:hypothetical protein
VLRVVELKIISWSFVSFPLENSNHLADLASANLFHCMCTSVLLLVFNKDVLRDHKDMCLSSAFYLNGTVKTYVPRCYKFKILTFSSLDVCFSQAGNVYLILFNFVL